MHHIDGAGRTPYSQSVKITVELSDEELREVIRVSGTTQKGPAIRKIVLDALMLRRRAATTEKFMNGEWGAELKGFEKLRALDRKDTWRR